MCAHLLFSLNPLGKKGVHVPPGQPSGSAMSFIIIRYILRRPFLPRDLIFSCLNVSFFSQSKLATLYVSLRNILQHYVTTMPLSQSP